MIGRQISHFRVVDKLGEGGMGVVYDAEDERLGRRVALKILQPEYVENEERRLRFLREARAIAAVTHPSIATIYDVGEDDGVIFIAMEKVEGRTLSDVIGERDVPVREALKHAIAIAEGLTAAHAAGVVHRDLKSDNIIVTTDGRIKILDFGLAKLRAEAATSATDSATQADLATITDDVTRDGRVMGTAAYMSPEQARGLEVDERSDVFSLGIVLYEMLTRTRPYHGATTSDLLSSILRDAPPPAATRNPDVTPELESILEKCLEKDAADRYQHADELVVDLRRLRRRTESQTASQLSSAATEAARDPRSRTIPYAIGVALAVIVLAVGFFSRNRGGPETAAANAVAVMPLENLRDGSDEQRLGRVLQELIITDLSSEESVKILSSQRLIDIQRQIGAPEDLDADVASEVARRAGAGHMLTGALSQLGDKYIVTCQVIKVSDGTVVGSQRVDGDDLYAMVDRLTAAIRSDLNLTAVVAVEETPVAEKTTGSIEAYGHFVRGSDALNELDWSTAVEELERATDIDPRFGAAHLRLSLARWWALEDESGWVDRGAPAAALEAALAEGSKLTGKDRDLAEAFLPLIRQQYEAARPGFEVLVKRHPDSKEAWYGYGEALYHSSGGSDSNDALHAFRRTLELDPGMHVARYHICDIYEAQKRYDDVIAEVKVFLAENPHTVSSKWYRNWIDALAMSDRLDQIPPVVDEALPMMNDEEAVRLLINTSAVFRDDGQRDVSQAMLTRALEIDSTQTRIHNSLGWQARDDFDFRRAERHYRRALAINELSPGGNNGVFDIMRDERRYREGIAEATERIRRHPDFVQAYMHRLSMAVPTGDDALIQDALDGALDHITSDSERRQLYTDLGWDFRWLGHQTRAIEYFDKAIAIDPDNVNVNLYLGRAWSAYDLARFDEAERWFETLQERNLYFGGGGLASVYAAKQEYDRAIAKAREVIDSDTRVNLWSTSSLINALVKGGREEEAATELERALQETSSPRSRQRLFEGVGRIYTDVGRYDEAEALFARARALDLPENPWLAQEEMNLAARRGRWDDARKAIARALDILPREERFIVSRASIDLSTGDVAAATASMRTLLAEGPVATLVLETLAYSLCAQDGFEEARELADRLVEMKPNAKSYELLAWVLVAGEIDVAAGAEVARKAQQMPQFANRDLWAWPFQAPAAHTLGLAAMKNGEYRDAVEYLTSAQKARPQRPLIASHLAEAKDMLASSAP